MYIIKNIFSKLVFFLVVIFGGAILIGLFTGKLNGDDILEAFIMAVVLGIGVGLSDSYMDYRAKKATVKKALEGDHDDWNK